MPNVYDQFDPSPALTAPPVGNGNVYDRFDVVTPAPASAVAPAAAPVVPPTPAAPVPSTVLGEPDRGYGQGLNLIGKVGTGIVENAMAAGSGTAAAAVGDVAGLMRAATNKLGWTATSDQQNELQRWISSPVEIEQAIKRKFTYEPQTDTGQAIQKGIGWLATPITATTRYAGGVVGALTGSDVLAHTVEDAGNIFGPGALLKAGKIAGVATDTTVRAWNRFDDPVAKGALVGILTNTLLGNPLGNIGHMLELGAAYLLGTKGLTEHIKDTLKNQRELAGAISGVKELNMTPAEVNQFLDVSPVTRDRPGLRTVSGLITAGAVTSGLNDQKTR
jgi:hypothetical protein